VDATATWPKQVLSSFHVLTLYA
jgi:hypothetical protein